MEKFDDREQERLQELYNYNILDTVYESDYDQITQLAALICDAPMSLISLVDKDRQWFKSRYGVADSETPREISFCSHAIRTPDDPFIVRDARLDGRFMENPMVTGNPNVVFYAGIPLVSNGHGLGTICVVDTQARELTEAQLEGLRILSDMALNLLNRTRINHELDKTRDNLLIQNAILNRNTEDLEQRLDAQAAQRILEIADQNKILEKVNKELEAFAYISSHDLQEPLRKIQTFTSLIVERESENLSGKGREYLEKIAQASQRMSTLIRDLLAYSRSTAVEKTFETTTLQEIVDDVAIDLEIELKNRKATLEVCKDCKIRVIFFQFRQLVYNLVSNSLKFSREGQPPHISVECSRGMGSDFPGFNINPNQLYYRISVTDNGIGFRPEHNERIFELFQRLSSGKMEVGTGIGLAIVKKIVDNHKGHIFASGQENVGATFDIFIPDTGL